MMAARAPQSLVERLPVIRGRVQPDAPLALVTWFRVGGPAEAMARPDDGEDLGALLAGMPADVRVTVIGVGSNLLVRDGGVEGLVIRLGRGFADIARADENGQPVIIAGAAVLDVNLALFAAGESLAGLEFLRGIPGTIGGALRMNAGAYGTEIKDVLIRAEAYDRQGRRHLIEAKDMALAYRHCGLPDNWIFTRAWFKAQPGDAQAIAARMKEITDSREATQPVRSRTGGSTFANPPGHKAWALIDAAGCRGLQIGDAQVSPMHCNFLINLGSATAADLESLGEEVRRRVQAASGIDLRWEIRRIGKTKGGGEA